MADLGRCDTCGAVTNQVTCEKCLMATSMTMRRSFKLSYALELIRAVIAARLGGNQAAARRIFPTPKEVELFSEQRVLSPRLEQLVVEEQKRLLAKKAEDARQVRAFEEQTRIMNQALKDVTFSGFKRIDDLVTAQVFGQTQSAPPTPQVPMAPAPGKRRITLDGE